jgi:two-component system cell cycle sensor histidine kinase/response regulator CckA
MVPAPAASYIGVMPKETRPTILVVDDDSKVVQHASRLLSTLGYRVIPADSAEEALSIFAGRAAEIDLVLTDILMPGLTGPELAELLHREKPELPVLLMTGFAGRYQGAPDLIEKPFGMAELQQMVARALENAPSARSLKD